MAQSANRVAKVITNTQLRARRDKLQIVTLEETLTWERGEFERCTARQETIDVLAKEVEEQKERLMEYEARIAHLVSSVFYSYHSLTCHCSFLQEAELAKRQRPPCGHCMMDLARGMGSRLRAE